ncbi:MAG: glycosyltransferase family 2 protein [Phormidesmis sp.]
MSNRLYSWTLTMSEDGKQFYPGKSPSFAGNVYRDLLLSNFIASGSNVMVRRAAVESVGPFDSTVNGVEDWDYCLRLAQKWPFALVPKAQILYRQMEESTSSKVRKMEKVHFVVHDKFFRDSSSDLKALEPQSRSVCYRYLTKLAIAHAHTWRDVAFALKRLLLSIWVYPKGLLNKEVYLLILKMFLITVLTPAFGKKALDFLRKIKVSRTLEDVPVPKKLAMDLE